MSNIYGENIKLIIFGQSHSKAIGMTLEGIPAGNRIDMAALIEFLLRRAPGRNSYSTSRQEADIPEFLCGIVENVTCGAPLTAIIHNTDARSSDYEQRGRIPRPGHADYTAEIKYGGYQDYAGGGSFSGRLTAPLCIAGGICMQLLAKDGIQIISRISSIGDISDKGPMTYNIVDKNFPVVDKNRGEKMKELIARMKKKGDSVGGIIECAVLGVPAGIGDPMFDGMENRIANIIFGIPAVKGIEFGSGFESANMTGSEHNDPFCVDNGNIRTKSNNSGGILGGISNGMPLTFRIAVKPTPSISIPQASVNMDSMSETDIVISGRHDPCIVPRAVPCVEAAAAVAIYDALLGKRR